jgi:hypothetical protein
MFTYTVKTITFKRNLSGRTIDSFDSQTRTSTRVSTARFTRETLQGAIEACRFERFHGKMRIESETAFILKRAF